MPGEPMRRLFGTLENRPENHEERQRASMIRQQEALRVCALSVEHFRRRYNFNLVTMSADDVHGTGVASSETDADYDVASKPMRLCFSCGSLFPGCSVDPTPASRSSWTWTSVCVGTEYVPRFYHSTRCCSGSCDKPEASIAPETVPLTPVKQHQSRSMFIRTTPAGKSSLSDVSPSKTSDRVQLKIPSLVQLWQARIRRNSCTTQNMSCTTKTTSDESRPNRNRCESQTRGLNSRDKNERPTLRVPFPSPVRSLWINKSSKSVIRSAQDTMPRNAPSHRSKPVREMSPLPDGEPNRTEGLEELKQYGLKDTLSHRHPRQTKLCEFLHLRDKENEHCD